MTGLRGAGYAARARSWVATAPPRTPADGAGAGVPGPTGDPYIVAALEAVGAAAWVPGLSRAA